MFIKLELDKILIASYLRLPKPHPYIQLAKKTIEILSKSLLEEGGE